MSEIAIQVSGLGKRYSLGGARKPYRTARETLSDLAAGAFRRRRGPAAADGSFWALKDVNFTVNRGEVVGIIGRNGAGKSTLLKVLSRITDPTEGGVDINGRVGSLLEVGTGFHPELTGRENVYLNGAILGMARAEVAKKFDAIIAFAETEKFVDTPVKHYSSGMYTRLAFAVAAHLESEVLLLDEVLAVGDQSFQEKCLGQVERLQKQGRTCLLVSHNLGTIARFANRAIVLNKGRLSMIGDTGAALADYREIRSAEADARRLEVGVGGAGVDLLSVETCDARSGEPRGTFDSTEAWRLRATVRVTRPLPRLRIAAHFRTGDGLSAFASNDRVAVTDLPERREPGVYTSECIVPGNLLNKGTYTVSLSGDEPGIRVLFDEQDVVSVEVLHTMSHAAEFDETWLGPVCPRLDWTVRRAGGDA